MTAAHRGREDLPGVAGGREGHPRGEALLEAVADVLEHVLELEERRVVVLAHGPGLQAGHRRAARPGGHDLLERVEVHAGGAAEDFERARALFDVMGRLVLHVGELGQGQMLKLVNNAVAAANAVALGQALLVAQRTGVDLDALTQVMAAGSGGSTMLDLKAGPMRAHDYTTLFKTEHMLKDVRHCLEEGQAAGVPFPAAASAREVLTAAVGRGHGDADFASVIDVLEGMAGVRLGA